jgi:signal transduction histidine kinase
VKVFPAGKSAGEIASSTTENQQLASLWSRPLVWILTFQQPTGIRAMCTLFRKSPTARRRRKIRKILINLGLCYRNGLTDPLVTNETKPEAERFHRFTSTTVHHLREPVRMLSVYSEMLRSELESPHGTDPVQSIEFLQQAAHQMQKLLDGLAELAFATDPKLRASRKVRLDLPLRQALLRLDGEIKAADAKVSYTDLPEVLGEIDRLEMVFQHLIGNAIRYRKDLVPEIEVSAEAHGDEWIISISDNGPGILPDFREMIFEPYSRLHGRELHGNGLGLAICREIVESLGGKIWVESRAGGGAVFLFTLPSIAGVV